MAVRTAVLRSVGLDSSGSVINKNKASIGKVIQSTSDFRVFEYQNGSAPNASSIPSIDEYLDLENNDGYHLVHFNNSLIVTSTGNILNGILSQGFDLLDDSQFSRTYSGGAIAKRNPWTAASVPGGTLRERFIEFSSSGKTIKQAFIEGPRTNTALHSSELTNAWWSSNNVVLTADIVESPYGSMADRIAETATTPTWGFRVFRNGGPAGIAAGQQLCVSCIAKAAGRNFVVLHLGTQAAGHNSAVCFDLVNGVVTDTHIGGTGAQTLDSYGIKGLGDGWFFCWIAGTPDPARSINEPGIWLTNSGTPAFNTSSQPIYAGTSGLGVYIDGVQFEIGVEHPSSYIPTVGSAVTRAADDLVVDLTGLPGGGIATNQGEIFAIGAPYKYSNPTFNNHLMRSVLPNNNAYWLGNAANPTQLFSRRNGSAGTNQIANTTVGMWQADVQAHYGHRYTNDSVALFKNGTLLTSNPTTGPFDLVTSLAIGRAHGAFQYFFGAVSLYYFPTPLSNTERTVLAAAISSNPNYMI